MVHAAWCCCCYFCAAHAAAAAAPATAAAASAANAAGAAVGACLNAELVLNALATNVQSFLGPVTAVPMSSAAAPSSTN